MKKSVYSIVLSDEIVSAVDRLAYINGTTRSGMINRILAEYVSYETPEMRLRNIFNEITGLLCADENFKLMSDATDTVMSLRSPIVYKYNPSVRYFVELYKSTDSDCVGELRVALRTQNATLISEFSKFCRAFDGIERRCGVTTKTEMTDGKYSRAIVPRANTYAKTKNSVTLGDMIGRYIYMFDNCLKSYFSSDGEPNIYMPNMLGLYSDYLESNREII